MQITVERCTSICINALTKTIKKDLSKKFSEASPDEIHQYMIGELNKVSVNDQVFEYDSMDNHLGGYRWFFLCPKCRRRAGKLFLPPVGKKEHKYLCKTCHKLKNQSAIMGQNSMYRKVTKPLRRMKEIEDKISKGHLKSQRIQDLLNEYEAIEKQLKAAPEYRLFSFKKTHNLI